MSSAIQNRFLQAESGDYQCIGVGSRYSISSYNGLIHTLFTMEGLYGLRIDNLDNELCICIDKGMDYLYLRCFQLSRNKLKN